MGVRLTEVLEKEAAGSDDDALSTSSSSMGCAHMCLRNDSHMHPTSLSVQFRTRSCTSEGIVDFTLRRIDVVDSRRGRK
jgi:hypothetical protein